MEQKNPLNSIFDALDRLLNMLITYVIAGLMGGNAIGYEVGRLMSVHKGKIILIVIGIPSIVIIFFLSFIAEIYNILQNPLKDFTTITAEDFRNVVGFEGIPEILKNYQEDGFVDSGIPHNSPFGKKGTEWTYITAGYYDPTYAKYFGHNHTAVDIVPNQAYYQNNIAYQLYKDVIIVATCSGQAKGLVDGNGANYIYLICDGEKYSLLFVHNALNFIKYNEIVHVIAGQPIAVMGSTGNSTGPHVHYQIRDYKTGSTLNPMPFINQEIYIQSLINNDQLEF